MKHPVRFAAALAALSQQQEAVVVQLRVAPDDAQLRETKRELDHAIRCLNFCESHQLHPDARVMVLPWPRDHFGSFGLVELDEAGEPLGLEPLAQHGRRVELSAGNLVVQQDHQFNLPRRQAGDAP